MSAVEVGLVYAASEADKGDDRDEEVTCDGETVISSLVKAELRETLLAGTVDMSLGKELVEGIATSPVGGEGSVVWISPNFSSVGLTQGR